MNSICESLRDDFGPKEDVHIPTGIANIDYICSGGLPRGKIVEIHSEAGLGKTTLVLQIAASYMELGFRVAFLDVEHSLTERLKAQMGMGAYEGKKCSPGWPQFLHLTPTTFNEIDQAMQAVTEDDADYDLIILDSLTMAVPDRPSNSKKGVMISDEENGLGARIQARFLRFYKSRLFRSDTTMIVLNQMRTNLKGWKIRSKPAGGKALEFASDIRLSLVWKKAVKDKIDGQERITGADLVLYAIKNKFAAPFVKVPLRMKFGYGVDDAFSTALLLIEHDLIKRTGSWYEIPGLERKVRGQDAIEWVSTNPEKAMRLLNNRSL